MPVLPARDLDRLTKLLGSDHDNGERANAARM